MTLSEVRPVLVRNDSATEMFVQMEGKANSLSALPGHVCDLRDLTQSPVVHLDRVVVQFKHLTEPRWTPTPQRRATAPAQQKVCDVYRERSPE